MGPLSTAGTVNGPSRSVDVTCIPGFDYLGTFILQKHN